MKFCLNDSVTIDEDGLKKLDLNEQQSTHSSKMITMRTTINRIRLGADGDEMIGRRCHAKNNDQCDGIKVKTGLMGET